MPTEAHGAGACTLARVKHAEPQLESEVLRKMLTRVCGVTQEGVNPAGHSNAPQIPTEQLSLHQPPLPAGAAPLCCPLLAAPICISSKSLTSEQQEQRIGGESGARSTHDFIVFLHCHVCEVPK